MRAPLHRWLARHAEASDADVLDLELMWLIERVDTIRLGTESRASMALSAAALLLGGIAFIFGNTLLSHSEGAQYDLLVKILIVTFLGIAAAFVLASVVMSTAAIVNVFTTSRRIVNNRIPSRIFIHSWDTVHVYPDFEAFLRGFEQLGRTEFREACLAYLWAGHHLYMKRYLTLRRAIRSLLISIVFFSCGLAVIVANVFLR